MDVISILLLIALIYVLYRFLKLRKEYAKIKNPQEVIRQLEKQIEEKREIDRNLTKAYNSLSDDMEALSADIEKSQKKLKHQREIYNAIVYALEHKTKLPPKSNQMYDAFCPSVMLTLNAMNSKQLHKEYKENTERIEQLATATISEFERHFSSQALSAVYRMTVIAMQAELQNILYNLSSSDLDEATKTVKAMTTRYYELSAVALQTITGNLKSLVAKLGSNMSLHEELRQNILQLEFHFINAVKIEYNYYLKKAQEKEEQAALREQMRIEEAERKALAEMQKKVEQEEAKYLTEIKKLAKAIEGVTTSEERKNFEYRIGELQLLLAEVSQRKEEIATLQNGKAGTVYIISNLGSFGENVFKIGMTRRLEPQERVNELGDASVPFRFDVHSFIFSEDAVALEHNLHTILNEKRLNKINTRKEFFRVTLDELEQLVYEIEPTAYFSRTMVADEYRQSIAE